MLDADLEEVLRMKPSVVGFLRKYFLSTTPVIAMGVYITLVTKLSPLAVEEAGKLTSRYIPEILLKIPSWVLDAFGVKLPDISIILPSMSILVVLLIVSWLFSSAEAKISTFLTILIALALSINPSQPVQSLANFNEKVLIAAIAASLITLLRTEIYRRSITYTLRNADLLIQGGIWRRQQQSIPYNHIGRVVLEQSWLGKLLSYGTVIPVGTAEWGSEYYTKAVGVSKDGIAVGYARTLKEVSRDPLKCLYGIRKPEEVVEKLQKMITVPYRAEIDQVEYLKKIAEE